MPLEPPRLNNFSLQWICLTGSIDCKECSGNDLGSYITQVNTDIGKSFNKELILNKIAKVGLNPKFGFRKSKRECKMASATNPQGISSEEYGKFAIHVYQYLLYINKLRIPSFEEIKESGKLVDINTTSRSKLANKSYISKQPLGLLF